MKIIDTINEITTTTCNFKLLQTAINLATKAIDSYNDEYTFHISLWDNNGYIETNETDLSFVHNDLILSYAKIYDKNKNLIIDTDYIAINAYKIKSIIIY